MFLNEEEIKKIPNRYKNRINYIDKTLQKYSQIYNLKKLKLYDDMNYSIVGSAISNEYGDVIFKIILDTDFNYSEIEMLKIYNGNYSCKLIIEENGFYLIEKLKPGTKLSEENLTLEEKTKIVCNIIDNLTIPVKDGNKHNIKNYNVLLENAYTYCEKNNIFLSYVKKSKEFYNIIKSKNLPLYFLHNDLHTYNILKSNDTFKSIDPHGVIGEKIFEYPPFIINEHWANKGNSVYF